MDYSLKIPRGRRLPLIFAGMLLALAAAAAAFFVPQPYNSIEAVNVNNIQNAGFVSQVGFKTMFKRGQVVEFRFSDGFAALFQMYNPGTSYQWMQVSPPWEVSPMDARDEE